jgi:hypothetical protein
MSLRSSGACVGRHQPRPLQIQITSAASFTPNRCQSHFPLTCLSAHVSSSSEETTTVSACTSVSTAQISSPRNVQSGYIEMVMPPYDL